MGWGNSVRRGRWRRRDLLPDETILDPWRNRPETVAGYWFWERQAVKTAQEAVMNHSIYGADRMTHIKIVAIALVASVAVAGFGILARGNSDDSNTKTAHVVKAGKAVTITSSDAFVTR
jgi:hypothetical protein